MALFRARKKTSNIESEVCPSCSDLLLLRDAAADERNAIAFYLDTARNCCMPQLFLDVAEDEMAHYVEIMREISRLDPVQAEMFQETNLDMLVMTRPAYKPKAAWHIPNGQAEAADVVVTLPDREDMPTVKYLTRALSDELQAANKYQRYMLEADERTVKKLFCHLMNEEKEHIAEFTAALFELTHEPLPIEPD